MIALTRSAVRQFRLVARRGFASGRQRAPAPPVRISAGENTINLAAHFGDVVITWRMSAPQFGGSGSLILPLTELERFEGNKPEVVTLEARSADRGIARWQVGEAPCTAEFALADCELEWPTEPEHLISMPPVFPLALHEAGRTAARDSGKYAVDRIQVRGKTGQVIGTDGKQALVQGGFVFPFAEDLVIPAVPVFGSKELACERDVGIGLKANWLFVAIGPWQLWFLSDPEMRFPDVMAAIPRAAGTRVVFDDRDVEKVLALLAELPNIKGEDRQAVTLDLGRHVAVRFRNGAEGEVVEVPLPRSECNGPEVQVVLDRDHLGRALVLGFREFRCPSPERPFCARDAKRFYLTATLDPKSAVPHACSAAQVATAPISDDRVSAQPDSPSPSRSSTMPSRESSPAERNGQTDAVPEELIDPLVEADALRSALTEATQRAARLHAALKHYRKERKSLQAAWSSLRGLNLGS